MWRKRNIQNWWSPSDCCISFWYKKIQKVNKIVGPGNKFVAAAKKEILVTLVLI